MKFINALKAGLFSLVLMALLSACAPDLPDYIADYDLVYTKEQKGFDFSTVKTYFLPDTVIYAPAGSGADKHQYDALIVSTIKTNLDALGWTRLSTTGGSAKADLVVLPVGNSQVNGSCVAYCWWCYWGWYPGWGYYPPGWGGGWGWGYPSDIVCTSYNSGTISVSFANPNAAANNTLPITWVGILNGLVEGTDAEIRSRIQANINQMFIQSPYLNK